MLLKITGTRRCKGNIDAVYRLGQMPLTRLLNALRCHHIKVGSVLHLRDLPATQALHQHGIIRTPITHAPHRPPLIAQRNISPHRASHLSSSHITVLLPLGHLTRPMVHLHRRQLAATQLQSTAHKNFFPIFTLFSHLPLRQPIYNYLPYN